MKRTPIIKVNGEDMVETPHTKQLIPAKNRWKNELFVREYALLFSRKGKDNIKPYKDDNGNTKQIYYTKKKIERIICPICNTELYSNFLNRHYKSQKHISNCL